MAGTEPIAVRLSEFSIPLKPHRGGMFVAIRLQLQLSPVGAVYMCMIMPPLRGSDETKNRLCYKHVAPIRSELYF